MRVRMKVSGVLARVRVILDDSSRQDAGVFSVRWRTPAAAASFFGRPPSALIGTVEPTPELTRAGQPEVTWSTNSIELKLSPCNSSPNDVSFTAEYGQFRNASSWDCKHANHERPCGEEFFAIRIRLHSGRACSRLSCPGASSLRFVYERTQP